MSDIIQLLQRKSSGHNFSLQMQHLLQLMKVVTKFDLNSFFVYI